MPHYENFDSRFAFAQDDTQTRPYTADDKNDKLFLVSSVLFPRGQSFGLMFWSENFFKFFLFSLDKGVHL